MSAGQSSALSPEQTPAREPQLHFLERLWRAVVSFFKQRLVYPLIAALISAMIIGRVVGLLLGPSAYTVYIVGFLSEPETAAIAEGFSSSLPKINGVPIEVKRLDDMADPDNAERISLELAKRKDTLAVVGHMYSTPTQKALPAYLQVADPPIPVILTTETNPNLLPSNTASLQYYPVFRLSPTDDHQAEKAAEFIASQGGKSIWVVEDRSNQVYSHYLARKFVERINEMHGVRVLLWSTTYTVPPAYAISDLGIDWVFFAGDWQNAVVLIRQLKAMPKTVRAKILLTDWSVDQRLLKSGQKDVENVYLTHALPVTSYNKQRYGVYGKDADLLLKQLIEDADQHFAAFATRESGFGYRLRRFLGIRRVSDSRRALSQAMQTAIMQQRAFKLSEDVAVFGADGCNTRGQFQVWQIRNNNFDTPK